MRLPDDFTLETPRCRLRQPCAADIPHVYSATRFPGFNDGMLWDPPATEAELQAPLQRSLAAWRNGEAFSFSIDRKEDGVFVGRIGIRPTDRAGIWSIGFWLHPEHQGRGLMTDAARSVLGFGFSTLGASAIEACHATWNAPSRRVLERIGMKEVGFIEQGYQKRGAWVPEYRMRIAREQFASAAVSSPSKSPGAEGGIRPATESDFAAIGHIHVDGWRAAYRGIMPDDFLAGLSSEQRAAGWAAFVKRDPRGLLVMVRDAAVVGWVAFGENREGLVATGEVYALYVAPASWRQGCGRELLAAAERELQSRGCDAVVLYVLERNTFARAFYHRMGYTDDGGRKVETMAGVELVELRMRKDAFGRQY